MRFLETGIDVRRVSGKSSLHPFEHPLPHVPQSAVRPVTARSTRKVFADGTPDAVYAGRQWLRDVRLALRAGHELSADAV